MLINYRLTYSPEQGKFVLGITKDDKSIEWKLTVHELIAALRDFERQIAEGKKDLQLKLAVGGINLENCSTQTAIQLLAYMKQVWENFRRTRYGLETQ